MYPAHVASKYSGRRAGYRPAGPCRQCERPQDVCGRLSSRRLCADCGEANMNQAAREIVAGAGPHYEQWRQGYIDSAARLARQ